MIPVSIIIVAKNEESVISKCLESVQHLSDDIIVCDTGSTDKTPDIVHDKGIKLINLKWQGYGVTKNTANTFAKYDWILQLDADEYIDEALKKSLTKINFSKTNYAYKIRRKRIFMNKILQFGDWGFERRIRLFPRDNARWTDDLVHERIEVKNVKTVEIKGCIYDQTFKSENEFARKMDDYAIMCAKKYYNQNVKGSSWKRFLSPIYSFLMTYIVRLGFLDGKVGILHAKIITNYTYKKYSVLYNLQKGK